MQNRPIKTWKNTKSAPQNLKLDYDIFDFLGHKFDFENFKIGFFNSSRISIRDTKM